MAWTVQESRNIKQRRLTTLNPRTHTCGQLAGPTPVISEVLTVFECRGRVEAAPADIHGHDRALDLLAVKKA